MLRTSCKLTYIFKIKKNLWVQPLATCSTATRSDIENNLLQFSKYEVKILQLVNTSKLNRLTKFISASHATTLISKRTSNGPYKSLNDVLLKTEIDVDSWNNFCTSFINHYKKEQCKKFKNSDMNITTMPATMLGIYVGPTAVTWSLVDCDFNVLVWDSIIWQVNSLSNNLIESVPLFIQKLPLSSSYVMEELKITNKLYRPVFIKQYQIANSIGSCIKLIINQRTNNSNSSENILHILKSSTTARFFNLLIGSEVISVDHIVEKILDPTKTDDEWLRNVHIADELKQKYMNKVPPEREQMGRSLLTTLACLHIVNSSIS